MVTLDSPQLEILLALVMSIDFDHYQPFLSIGDPQNTRVHLGGQTQLSCHLAWKDAFGQPWIGDTPTVQIQWIINGFGFTVDIISFSFHGRLTVVNDTTRGIYDLQINHARVEDEGTYACQAQILNEDLSASRLAKNRQWNEAGPGFASGYSTMRFVRSKEVNLFTFSKPKNFGLFITNISQLNGVYTDEKFVLQNSLPILQEFFVQSNRPLRMICMSLKSRPLSQLDFTINGRVFASLERHDFHCQEETNSSSCLSTITKYRSAKFDLQIRLFKNAIESKVFTSGIIIEGMIRPGLTNALKCQCRLKNSEEFLESNSSISTLKTYIPTKIYPHEPIDESKEKISFRCKGFATMYKDQTIVLRWSVNKRDINETSSRFNKVAENIGMFTGNLDIQIKNLPPKCTIRCSVYSTISTAGSNRFKISRVKMLRFNLKGSTSILTNAHSEPVTSLSVSKSVAISTVFAIVVLSTIIVIIFKRKALNSTQIGVIPQSERESPEGCSVDNFSPETIKTSNQNTRIPLRLLPEIGYKPNNKIQWKNGED